MKMMAVEDRILATLAFAHAYERPLTAWETHRCLVSLGNKLKNKNENGKTDKEELRKGDTIKFLDVIRCLDSLRAAGRIGGRWGYYFLSGNEHLVDERLARLKYADEKWKRAARAVRWLGWVPYLRAVFASGSLAISNTTPESDLDILIITAPGRIFTARFFVTATLFLLRAYRHGGNVADRVCPNHYITEASLEIPFRSPYTAQQYANLVPIFVKDERIAERFYAENQWIGEYVTSSNLPLGARLAKGGKSQISKLQTKVQDQRTIPSNFVLCGLASLSELLLNSPPGDLLEKILRRMQLARIEKNPATSAPGHGHVVANDRMLAFHPHSPEKRILEKYMHAEVK